MRRIVHLSDVHFGAVEPGTVEPLVAKVRELDPDVVVVSGDLTQRARGWQFREAKTFLDRLPRPQVVVPGNHDIPAYNLLARFFAPLAKYKRYISDDLEPTFFDDELAVVGINTARSNVTKNGRINEQQIEFVRSTLCHLNGPVLKVVVTHHPFVIPEGSHHKSIVGRAEVAVPAIESCGGDVLMSGHLHVSHIETTAKRYKLPSGGNALVIQAGTATSTRVRGEPHSFNVVDFDEPRLVITRLESRLAGEPFATAEVKTYIRTPNGWTHHE